MTPESGTQPKGLVTLPTGTVTFLFTDIEGSTQRWEAHRDAMDSAVKRHDEVLRSAIEGHGGRVFKTVGDAFCTAFARSSDAVAASVAAQQSLSSQDFAAVDGLRVRMGLHTGEAAERDRDYFGPAVNRAARLMSIGHGGQVLMSQATRDLAHPQLPANTLLVDLGSHPLRDLAEPERVWQLNIAGLPTEFPPLLSLDTFPNNLPLQRTTFVGRERDVAAVKELIGRHRLLTIVGSGGVGKTRLAVQVGADLLDHYPDGVWLADFGPITDPELASSVIAKALGMNQPEGRRVDESIPPWLKRKKLLLILDNCEHVLQAVAKIVDAILDTTPDVHIVITSRQVLGVSGEEVLRLPSLDVPHEAGLSRSAAMEFGAVALFVDRAKSVDKSFVVTDENAPALADICRRLDGIPLAIELAAARAKVLSIPHLARRLNDRFKILTGGSRTALPRQKTLSALIDWSYDLLSPEEQMLFSRLGTFASGFGLEAATTVCGGDGFNEMDILDLLASLTDKSLVVAETGGERERYHLLESTRAYALEKLTAIGKLERQARRHAEYFRDQAQRADERYGMGSSAEWLIDVELELDNYRAALEWALTQSNDAALGGAIAGALGPLWREGGLAAEGRWWINAALERLAAAESPTIAARLWLALANLTSGRERRESAHHACALYDTANDSRGSARALYELSLGLSQTGQIDAGLHAIEKALEKARTSKDELNVAHCLRRRAVIFSSLGDTQAARPGLQEAIAAFRALGDKKALAEVLLALGENDFQEGDERLALRHASESMAILSKGRHTTSLAMVQNNAAAYSVALGALDEAHDLACESLRAARDIQDLLQSATALQHIATIAGIRGEAKTAARLKGFVDAAFRALGCEREYTERWGNDKLMSSLHEQLSEAAIGELMAEGAAWSEDHAVEEALKL